MILSLLAALSGLATGQDHRPIADPMSDFTRLIPGTWRRTAQSGTSLFDTWHWGPGRHSVRVTTDGLNAAGDPWRELQVFYWHPGRKQISLLSLHPVVPGIGPGVSEGTIRFEGDTAEAVCDLFQPRGRRKLKWRWVFHGPDRYRATLLESAGGADYQPLVEWDLFRMPRS